MIIAIGIILVSLGCVVGILYAIRVQMATNQINWDAVSITAIIALSILLFFNIWQLSDIKISFNPTEQEFIELKETSKRQSEAIDKAFKEARYIKTHQDPKNVGEIKRYIVSINNLYDILEKEYDQK